MTLAMLIAFAVAVGVAMASPGPTIVTLVARVVTRGRGGLGWFCTGLVLGDVVWFSAAVFGLAALAQAAQPLFVALKYAGAAYLAWLAWKLWTAPAAPPAEGPAVAGDGPRLLAGGLILALGNPKTMMFYIALLPALFDLTHLDAATFGVLLTILVIVFACVLAGYIVAADRARRLVRSARAVQVVNRISGTMMGGAAAAIAVRT
jgi:threonine/homoserine/homoserine lactone efflux protein